MRIAAMGAGGVGGYFGARLQQAGHDVAFIARGRHLQALLENGLSIRSSLGDTDLKIKAFEKPADAGPADVVLFAVKLWDTESAAERLRPIIGKDTLVIPFQNGVESSGRLGALLGKECVAGGSAYIATRIKAPGVIEHTGTMARLQFGPLLASQRPAAGRFLEACRGAGVPAELADDFVEKHLAFADTLPHEMRASMLHDLEAGGRLEAPWLCGAVVRMSEEAGLDAPVNRTIYAALRPFVDGSASKAA